MKMLIRQLKTEAFSKESFVDRAGFEPATSALRRRRSYQTELPARLSEKNLDQEA
jgi:hypothetical protein